MKKALLVSEENPVMKVFFALFSRGCKTCNICVYFEKMLRISWQGPHTGVWFHDYICRDCAIKDNKYASYFNNLNTDVKMTQANDNKQPQLLRAYSYVSPTGWHRVVAIAATGDRADNSKASKVITLCNAEIWVPNDAITAEGAACVTCRACTHAPPTKVNIIDTANDLREENRKLREEVLKLRATVSDADQKTTSPSTSKKSPLLEF